MTETLVERLKDLEYDGLKLRHGPFGLIYFNDGVQACVKVVEKHEQQLHAGHRDTDLWELLNRVKQYFNSPSSYSEVEYAFVVESLDEAMKIARKK